MLQSQDKEIRASHTTCAIMIAQAVIYSCAIGMIVIAIGLAILQR